MNNVDSARSAGDSVLHMNPKLRAALDYLGDRPCTHRASRFTPSKQFLLGRWLAGRRTRIEEPVRAARLNAVKSP